ncbi:MAG: phage holin family protein [Acidimicrobiales bacterium]
MTPIPYGPSEADDRPLSELLSNMTAQLQQLVRKEIELARVETKDQIGLATKGVGAFGGAAAVGFVSLILLAFAAAWGLAEVVATGFAFLIVGAALLVFATVLAIQGKTKLARFRPVPPQTVQTVKEDVEIAKDSLQRGIKTPDISNYADGSGR